MGGPIPLYEPIENGTKDNVYISKSYDATSHFETTTGMSSTESSKSLLTTYITDDIQDIYQRAEGEALVVEGLREGENLATE
jgi:Rab GDP dissociation inhibitor